MSKRYVSTPRPRFSPPTSPDASEEDPTLSEYEEQVSSLNASLATLSHEQLVKFVSRLCYKNEEIRSDARHFLKHVQPVRQARLQAVSTPKASAAKEHQMPVAQPRQPGASVRFGGVFPTQPASKDGEGDSQSKAECAQSECESSPRAPSFVAAPSPPMGPKPRYRSPEEHTEGAMHVAVGVPVPHSEPSNSQSLPHAGVPAHAPPMKPRVKRRSVFSAFSAHTRGDLTKFECSDSTSSFPGDYEENMEQSIRNRLARHVPIYKKRKTPLSRKPKKKKHMDPRAKRDAHSADMTPSISMATRISRSSHCGDSCIRYRYRYDDREGVVRVEDDDVESMHHFAESFLPPPIKHEQHEVHYLRDVGGRNTDSSKHDEMIRDLGNAYIPKSKPLYAPPPVPRSLPKADALCAPKSEYVHVLAKNEANTKHLSEYGAKLRSRRKLSDRHAPRRRTMPRMRTPSDGRAFSRGPTSGYYSRKKTKSVRGERRFSFGSELPFARRLTSPRQSIDFTGAKFPFGGHAVAIDNEGIPSDTLVSRGVHKNRRYKPDGSRQILSPPWHRREKRKKNTKVDNQVGRSEIPGPNSTDSDDSDSNGSLSRGESPRKRWYHSLRGSKLGQLLSPRRRKRRNQSLPVALSKRKSKQQKSRRKRDSAPPNRRFGTLPSIRAMIRGSTTFSPGKRRGSGYVHHMFVMYSMMPH